MGSITLLLGKTRTRRRAALSRDQLAGNDVFGRPNFLYVTDTVRKVRLVQEEYLRYRRGASFVPEATTLSALLAELVRRYGDGRALWPEGAVALRARRMVTANPSAFPWLAGVGAPDRVGADLAGLHLAWEEAGRPALDGPRADELGRALRRLGAELDASSAWTTLGAAIPRLMEALGRPGPGLAAWLTRHPAVIIDDVLQPSPARIEALVALARAWRALGVHVVFAFESGRDLGGGEAAKFFGYDEFDEVSFSLRPFAATRRFRQVLFERLVAEGGEAEIALVGVDHHPRLVDPVEVPEVHEAPDVADALWGDGWVHTPPESVSLRRWADPESEVRGIAAAVKDRLLAGDDPRDLWVAFPGLPQYAPLVRRWFGRMGIPYVLSAGEPLLAWPVAALVARALAIPSEGWPVQALVDLARSPLVGRLGEAEGARLARRCREAGIFRGRPAQWRAALGTEWAEALDRLEALAEELATLDLPLAPARWREGLGRLLAGWDVPGRARRAPPAVAAGTIRALAAVLEAADGVALAWEALDEGPYPGAELGRALIDALHAARVLPDEREGGVVAVVGMLELRGIHPRRLWVGGLLADDFPPVPGDTWLVPRETRRRLGMIDPGEEGRYLFASLLRNATANGDHLTLSWPATRDDRPVAPSPLVEDLLRVRTPEGELRERVVDGGADPAPASPWERDVALGQAWREGPPPLPADAPPSLGAAVAALARRVGAEGFGPYDGMVLRPPPPPTPLSITRFETYLVCPARYAYAVVLGLEPEEPWDADLNPRVRGRVIHRVLERFVDSVVRDGGPPPWEADEARARELRARLGALAEAELAESPEFAVLPPSLAEEHRRRWLSGLVDEGPEGLLAAWYRVEATTPWPRRYGATERRVVGRRVGPLELEGRLDRVDWLDDGRPFILDYKTGRLPDRQAQRQGLAVQALLYLEALAEAHGYGVAAYEQVRSASKVEYGAFAGDSEALARLKVKQRYALDAAERAALARWLEGSAERLVAGTFHPTLAGAEAAGCAYCPYARICRVDHARAAALRAADDARWQAPRAASEEAR